MPFTSRTIDDLKSEGLFFTAGAQTFQKGFGRSYGCHFGLRSTLEADRAEFFAGYDAAERGDAMFTVVIDYIDPEDGLPDHDSFKVETVEEGLECIGAAENLDCYINPTGAIYDANNVRVA